MLHEVDTLYTLFFFPFIRILFSRSYTHTQSSKMKAKKERRKQTNKQGEGSKTLERKKTFSEHYFRLRPSYIYFLQTHQLELTLLCWKKIIIWPYQKHVLNINTWSQSLLPLLLKRQSQNVDDIRTSNTPN